MVVDLQEERVYLATLANLNQLMLIARLLIASEAAEVSAVQQSNLVGEPRLFQEQQVILLDLVTLPAVSSLEFLEVLLRLSMGTFSLVLFVVVLSSVATSVVRKVIGGYVVMHAFIVVRVQRTAVFRLLLHQLLLL